MNYTFDQAKQAVAQRHGYESWESLLLRQHLPVGGINKYHEEVFQIGCNEAVKAEGEKFEQQLNDLSMRLSDVFRLLIRYQNIHPEIFSDLDKMRVDKARETMQKYAQPFDPKQVLRKSEPFP